MTSGDHMRAAFAALLAGDTDERDRQCFLAEEALRAEAERPLDPYEYAVAAESTGAQFYASGLPLLRACQDTLGWLSEKANSRKGP